MAGRPWLGLAEPSAIALQTRQCLMTLKSTLEELKSSLALVLKADVHLASASDFYEFKLVWREFFPSNPPARLAIEVGETFPFQARLSMLMLWRLLRVASSSARSVRSTGA